MKTIEVERGKNLHAPFEWVDFVVRNPDILAALSPSPLKATKLGEKKFGLTIFGVQITLEEVHYDCNEKQGSLKWFANIQLSCGLCKTHTVTTYTYFLVEENVTSLDVSITIELTTMLMRLYAKICNEQIDRYLNRVCRDIESTAMILARDEKQARLRDADQQQRVETCRLALSRKRLTVSAQAPRVEGALRILLSECSLHVTAEARLPDQSIITANELFVLTVAEKAMLVAGVARLAGINNRAVAARGVPGPPIEGVGFRQVALEFGHQFFLEVCTQQLLTVVPVITNQGSSARLGISVEGEAEQLPWEVMHDGQEFICIKTCLSRCVTTLHPTASANPAWERAPIFIVGADSRGDLPGIEQETKGIGKALAANGLSKVEVLTGPKATRRSVLKALQSNEFGVFHFSGHSAFDPNHPHQSSLDLCGGTKIFLHELGHLSRSTKQGLPLSLVFLNSCQSAMIGHDSVTGRQLSMCKALREAGVPFVIGMMWNIEDDAAVQIGANFYANLMKNPAMGPEEAMRQTRLTVAIES